LASWVKMAGEQKNFVRKRKEERMEKISKSHFESKELDDPSVEEKKKVKKVKQVKVKKSKKKPKKKSRRNTCCMAFFMEHSRSF